MRLKLWTLLAIVPCFALGASAQDGVGFAIVRGTLHNKVTGEAAGDLHVTIPYARIMELTDAKGAFQLARVPYGRHRLVISSGSISLDTVTIVVARELVDLGILKITVSNEDNPQNTLISSVVSDDHLTSNDDGVEQASMSGLLTASRDVFQNTAAFVFGSYGFRARGYPGSARQVFVNGMPMNDIRTGVASWGQWAGLNDVFRGRSDAYGLGAADFAAGGLNGAVSFDATAANQEHLTSITYSNSNRQYRHRLMLTHSSGLLKAGWSYALSLGKRWGAEGFVEGSFYDSYSYYAAVSRQLSDHHQLNLTVFGVPVRRGKVAPATREAYAVSGDPFYNPNWGYQNGQKRNPRVAAYHQPAVILNHQYTVGDRTRWHTSLGYQWGTYTDAKLDWYNGADPRPDYYRYLPGWQYLLYGNDSALGAQEAAVVSSNWSSNPAVRQINWDRLYQVNYGNIETIGNVDGMPGNSFQGRRSVYVVGSDVEEIRKYTFNTFLQQTVDDHIQVYEGLSFVAQRFHCYKRLDDLLGGDYYVNYNQFAEREYVSNPELRQNDLDVPNRIVRPGEHYSYRYNSLTMETQVWIQSVFSFNRAEFFLCGSGGISSFQREGLYRTGLYPSSSKGPGPVQKFFSYSLKGGLTYKISGRHYVFVNAALMQDPPSFDNSFISPRSRNQLVTNIAEQKTWSVEGGYLLRTPAINGRLVGYSTELTGATQVRRFYHEDFETFVNYAIREIATRHTGVEVAIDYKLTPAVNVTGVAAYGQAFYTRRPIVSVYGDNDTSISGVSREVYLSDYYLAVGPQSAYSLGAKYRSRHDWFATATFSYFDRNYVDVSTERRTAAAVASVPPGSSEWHKILDQEQLPPFYTVDLFFYKSLPLYRMLKFLGRKSRLALSLGINNLLDRRDIVLGGFESARYESGAPDKFPPKYFPGYGRSYFANISLRF